MKRIHEGDKYKIIFIINYDLNKYFVMLIGLKNKPTTFKICK